ncbi:hypothetical protein B566_EDAN006537 [Ephemera danica]|nr:hypothetical protein B566_EDAN006537 [Ephemera danica]
MQIILIINACYVFCKEDVQSMMAVYIASRHHLDEVHWASLDPSVINNPAYLLTWLQCAAETGDVAGTTRILERMRQCGINVDEEIFAGLILAHGRAHDFPQVKNVLNTMKDSAVDLGLSTYMALLQAQIENNQPINNTVMQMRNDGIILKDLHLTRLIYSVAISKRDDLLNMVMRTLDVEKLSLELKNCAIELIHEGYPSFMVRLVAEYATAFGSQDAPNTFATFVPKELVASNMKPVDIVNFCKILQQTFPNHQSFLLAATEASLRDVTKTEMSIELLKHVTPLRNHYFWPLAVRAKHLQEVSAVLNLIQSLGLKLDSDTLTYYTYPNIIKIDTPINILKHLQKSCKLSVSSLLGPLVHALLNAKMLNEAIILCKQYKQRILDLHSMAKPLMSCTLLSKDYSATLNMLSLLSNSKNINERTVDIVGLFLTEYTAKCSPADLQQILMRDMGLEELEGHLIELKSKNLNTRGVLRRLLQMHCRLNNPERVLQIKKELDADGYLMSPGMLASILAMHLLNRDCENANLTLQQLTENYPHFVLDEYKIINFCSLKIMNGASKGEITKTLRNFTEIRHNQGSKIRGGAGIQRNCQELINSVREKWGETEAKNFVECLRNLNFM